MSGGKLPPFAWMGRDVLERLLEAFPAADGRSTALSVYAALSLLASEQRLGDQQAIQASRRRVAEAAGVSVRTLDSFTKRLECAGLLRVDRSRSGQLNLAKPVRPNGRQAKSESARRRRRAKPTNRTDPDRRAPRFSLRRVAGPDRSGVRLPVSRVRGTAELGAVERRTGDHS